MAFQRITAVYPIKGSFRVHLRDGTSFTIICPDFSDINDTMRFQYEMLSFGIHPIELEELMFALIIGLLFGRPIQGYERVVA